jgi:hypothetical protein
MQHTLYISRSDEFEKKKKKSLLKNIAVTHKRIPFKQYKEFH